MSDFLESAKKYFYRRVIATGIVSAITCLGSGAAAGSQNPSILLVNPPKYWKFIGDGKSSPINGIKFQRQGYSCKARRVFVGQVAGKEVTIQSNTQASVGAILRKAERALGLQKVYDENNANSGSSVQQIGLSLPVYLVTSEDGYQDYAVACAIWVKGKILHLGDL
jgi:hypothetical protein